MTQAILLTDALRTSAIATIKANHYTHSVPSGKSHYIGYNSAIVVWSIPANKNLAKFVLGFAGSVWELSRLWAPDEHEYNLLTKAIAAATRLICRLERPDALVSYADPSAGHKGGVYRAASWLFNGQSDEVRAYKSSNGNIVARRAFHSGRTGMSKAEIEASGFKQLKLPGKFRFVKPITRAAKRALLAHV